jgi:hypothetical protein
MPIQPKLETAHPDKLNTHGCPGSCKAKWSEMSWQSFTITKNEASHEKNTETNVRQPLSKVQKDLSASRNLIVDF